MRRIGYCILNFLESTTSLMSFSMSVYGLPFVVGKSYSWQHYLIVSCIFSTIVLSSVKQALMNDELRRLTTRNQEDVCVPL